jgi:hypothetical protein
MEFLAILLILLYFLPTVIARRRRHKNAVAIEALNWFLGWSGIAWIIALIWSLTDNVKEKKEK